MADGEPGTSDMCKICNINPRKYCCPRCNISFCSVDCYKSEPHADCSETFYRECVTEQLSSQCLDESSKQKMMEILNRLNTEIDDTLGDDDESDGSVDSDGQDLAERLKGVDLDDSESVWCALTDDEKKTFESLVQTGEVADVVPAWKPWWIYNKESKLVHEVNKDESTIKDVMESCPEIITNIQQLNITKQPADCVKYNLINVLSAYLYTVRLFNGDHFSSAVEAISSIISICNNIKNGANYEDAFTAVNCVIQECRNNQMMVSEDTNVENLNFDIICLLRGPDKEHHSFYVTAALSDLHRLITEAKTKAKTQKNLNSKPDTKNKAFSKRFPDRDGSNLPETSAVKLKMYLKKIEYYLSFVRSYSSDVTTDLFGFDLNLVS